jgi:hypothetical protein
MRAWRKSRAALKSLGVYERVRDRLVLGENIQQTAQSVQTGAADAGLLALSLAVAPPLHDEGRYAEVLAESYPRIEQGGVILTWAQDREATEALRAFLTGPGGQGRPAPLRLLCAQRNDDGLGWSGGESEQVLILRDKHSGFLNLSHPRRSHEGSSRFHLD